MVDATRAWRVTDSSDGVVCFVRTQSDLDGFAFANSDGTTRLLTGHEALRIFEAHPDELGLELRADHDEEVLSMVRGVLAAPQGAAGRLRGVRRTIWGRLGNRLTLTPVDASVALEELYQHPLTAEAERRLRSAVRAGASDEDLATRVAALHRDGQLTISHTGNDPVRIMSTMGVQL